jgi:hypothetical protein
MTTDKDAPSWEGWPDEFGEQAREVVTLVGKGESQPGARDGGQNDRRPQRPPGPPRRVGRRPGSTRACRDGPDAVSPSRGRVTDGGTAPERGRRWLRRESELRPTGLRSRTPSQSAPTSTRRTTATARQRPSSGPRPDTTALPVNPVDAARRSSGAYRGIPKTVTTHPTPDSGRCSTAARPSVAHRGTHCNGHRPAARTPACPGWRC